MYLRYTSCNYQPGGNSVQVILIYYFCCLFGSLSVVSWSRLCMLRRALQALWGAQWCACYELNLDLI
jgi:hypothetical protein